MHPILFKFGSITLYTYGLFVAIGFLAALAIAQKEAARIGIDPMKVIDLGFYMLIGAVVGARIFYLIVNPDILRSNPMEAFQIWKGGLVFYGGFIAAFVVAIVYVRMKHIPFLPVADIFSPGLAIGHAVGRIGCFFAGCCYGRECDLPWAVTFRDPMSLAPVGVHLHPTQLYEVGSNLLIFAILWFFRKKTGFPGQLFWLYVLLYGLARTLLEFFRGDPRGVIPIGLSSSQGVGLLMAAAAAIMLVMLKRRASKAS